MGWRVNDLTSHVYPIQEDEVQRVSGLVNMWKFGESGTAQRGHRDSVPFPLAKPYPFLPLGSYIIL